MLMPMSFIYLSLPQIFSTFNFSPFYNTLPLFETLIQSTHKKISLIIIFFTTMEYQNNLEESKSSSEETDRSSSSVEQIVDHDGRIYECVFCRRGFQTAQALGGHMNIHRKDRANNNNNNKAKPNFVIPQSSSSSIKGSYGTTPSSQVHYNNSEMLYEEIYQRDYWRNKGNLSLYTNPLLCVHENENNDKILKDKIDEEDGLDLELRLGHHHP